MRSFGQSVRVAHPPGRNSRLDALARRPNSARDRLPGIMEAWKLFLAVLATLATVGQFLVALSVYALQRSNERIARRIELTARIEQLDMASTLTISNLSTFGVW